MLFLNILAVLALLILLLCLLQLGVRASWGTDLRVTAILGPVRLPIIPQKEKKPKKEPKIEPKKEPVIKTTTTLLNVREKPSKNSNIMNVLEKGTKVTVVENIGEWSKLLDNTFVMSEYLK